MSEQAFVIGFDVGGTRLKSAAVTRDGTLLAEAIHPSGAQDGPEALLQALNDEVDRIAGRLLQRPRAVGIALPGAVHPWQGIVLLPGRLKGMEGFPLVPRLRDLAGLPVVAENDGRTSILAEKYYGLARDKNWAVTITLGTGVGSGVMLDGHILRDPHLQFGTQLGHLVMQPADGSLCLTGTRGTSEMLCSPTALALKVREGLQRGVVSMLTDRYFENPHAIDFEAVIEGVEQQDRLCVDEFERWVRNLGWLLVSATHAYEPEIIILSGGAVHAAKHFLEPLRAHVQQYIFRYPPGAELPIVISQVRDLAGVLGSAAVAWELADNNL